MTRGIRNNNPLNIRLTPLNDWMGKVMHNTDGAFEQFTSMTWGFRAAMILLDRYIQKGANTIRKIVSKWAPATDGNHTEKYIEDVCRLTQLGGNEPIIRGSEQHKSIVWSMGLIESGLSIADYKRQFEKAWDWYREEKFQKLPPHLSRKRIQPEDPTLTLAKERQPALFL